MSISVNFYLWSKPGLMLTEGEKVDPEELRLTANRIREHAHKISDIITVMQKDGWKCNFGLYDIVCDKNGINTQDQAFENLAALGVDLELVFIDHLYDDDEDDIHFVEDDDRPDEDCMDGYPDNRDVPF